MAATTFPRADEVRRRARTENFDVASLLLGSRQRAALLAIYDFARLVDEVGDSTPGDRLATLDEVEAELGRAFTERAQTPVFQQLAAVLLDTALPREPFARLVEANRRDQIQSEYDTYEDLVSYCELSANPVGELVLSVFDAATPPRIRLSDDVCTALQVIEHIQDVREDALAGRIYLPRGDRERFGVREDDLTADRASPALQALLAFECERAAGLLRSGVPLAASLPWRARIAVAGYVGGGVAALTALSRGRYDVLRAKLVAGRAARIAATARVLGSASWR
jgi:squalene synthase HpnC